MRVFAVILALLAALVFGLPNTDAGRRLIEREAASATGGQVVLLGLSGRFPDRLRLERLELRDAAGLWLEIDATELDWSPLRLLARELRIDRLAAARVAITRLPSASGGGGGGSAELPVSVVVSALQVRRLELGAALAGVPAALGLEGSGRMPDAATGEGTLTLTRLDGEGRYHLEGRVDAAALQLRLAAQEPAQGLAARLASLPDLGALDVTVEAAGPWSGVTARLSVAAGPLRATADGQVDLTGRTATLDLSAQAPAMTPRPDLSWHSVDLRAHVSGPFASPKAAGTLRIDALQAAGAALRQVTAHLSGDSGHVALQATLDGLALPGPRPDLFAPAPVQLRADADLTAAGRPVRLDLSHPVLGITGTVTTEANPTADLSLTLPQLAALVPQLQGHAALQVKAALQGDTTRLDLTGRLGLTGGMAPVPALLGPDAALALSASLRGADITLTRLRLDGKALTVAAAGTMAGGVIDLAPEVTLTDATALDPVLSGTLQAKGRVHGTPEDLSAETTLTGALATQGFPSAPVNAALQLRGLPAAPTGHVTADATLDGAKLTLAAVLDRSADGTLKLAIDRADWKSAHAEGTLTLPPGAVLPHGRIVARMTKLQDLQKLLGRPIAGAFSATAELDEAGRARLLAEASGIGPADTLKLEADGKQDALALRLAASGAGVQASVAGTLDAPGRKLALSALQATWQGERVALLAPARIAFADGVTVDRLRLGLRQAVLDIAGRVTPALDATASLRNLPADLAAVLVPGLQADGSVNADARLTGPLARPAGTVTLSATGLRLRDGLAASFPPATLSATATLAGAAARLDAQATLGTARASLSGTAPLDPAGALNLQARGNLDLALLDPVLAVEGRRARGRIALDGTVTGTITAPQPDGTLRLSGGDFQDVTQGARLRDIEAVLRAGADTVRIERLTAKAGNGTISATGSVGLSAPMPVDLRLTARDATPLASDRLTAVVDADLSLGGAMLGQMTAAGDIHIQRADIRVPERLPTSVAVLDVRLPGQRPPPEPGPGITDRIGLDLTVDAPSRVFVRGRGLDAELAGKVHVGGTAAAPRMDGGLTLRRGQFNLVGQTLTFTSGSIGLDGSRRIDPTLDFVASNTNAGVTATLQVAGYASAPKIILKSVPDLPQDEILAHLLFGQKTSSLGPLQIAQIAAGLAQITGVGNGINPLERLREGLGLDRLSVGGGQNGQSAKVEAGRYVAQGVYLGAKQSTAGAGTQATVQVDLWRGLKLEADVGTSSGHAAAPATGTGTTDSSGSSVGLTWQFDY
ncbi:translocation/assembly module TamB domain-containing protein [Limobrevibacterium gyesilva]|uniref:Translocation/assembly module TamB domain-containing protein n=1 Tax=Limobrevibacterium gyesilva TaxID=2991712 RepID=A0AA41YJV7_9PROT|nr:translocation/assembly module TamB domain-containing protein [Limobrevibacterium gyesilva]MCW3474549.1 translocation/assembly module TamB domain-containing protein [Limobrevibacterium gyesilva]